MPKSIEWLPEAAPEATKIPGHARRNVRNRAVSVKVTDATPRPGMVPTRVLPCLACTRSKVKCDKCSPCGRCVRLGLCCVETAPGRRSRQVTPDASPRRAFFACAAPDAPPPLPDVADLPFGPFAGLAAAPPPPELARDWAKRVPALETRVAELERENAELQFESDPAFQLGAEHMFSGMGDHSGTHHLVHSYPDEHEQCWDMCCEKFGGDLVAAELGLVRG
jgi:hypothetical protein